MAYGVMGWRVPKQHAGTSRSDGGDDGVVVAYEGVVLGAKEVMEAVRALGVVIDYFAFVVRLAQAPDIKGRLDVRWWVTGRRREPVVVRWRSAKSKLPPVRVRRLRREMVEAVAVEELRPWLWEALEGAREAMMGWVEMRGWLLEGRVPVGDGAIRRVKGRVEGLAERARRVHEGVERELARRGVPVEERCSVRAVCGG